MDYGILHVGRQVNSIWLTVPLNHDHFFYKQTNCHAMKNWNTRVVVGQREIVSIEEYSKHLLTDTKSNSKASLSVTVLCMYGTH